MSIEMKELGAAIKQVRTARGLSQVELAKAAGLAGSGNSVALIERGERSVSMGTLNALAKALDVPPACLTILGSTQVAGGPESNDFMLSLKKLIAATVVAQAQFRLEQEAEEVKQSYLSEIGQRLAELSESVVVEKAPSKRREKKSPSRPLEPSAKH